MAPRFTPGDDAEVTMTDGRVLGLHVTADHGDTVEGRPFGVALRRGDGTVFPAAAVRPMGAAPEPWRHADGLIGFAG